MQEEAKNTLVLAMQKVVHEKGSSFLLDNKLVNYLSDYQVRDNAYKNIIKSLQDSGYMEKIIKITNWNLESKAMCAQFSKLYGFEESKVLYVVSCIGFVLSKTNSVLTPNSPRLAKNNIDIDVKAKNQKSQQTVYSTPLSNGVRNDNNTGSSQRQTKNNIDVRNHNSQEAQLANSVKNKNNSKSNGCCGCLIILIFVGLIGGVLKMCGNDTTNTDETAKVAPQKDNVFFLPRTKIDTIRDADGTIIDMKKKEVNDIKLAFAPDTFYMETPYKCIEPSLSFSFDDGVFNSDTQKLQKEHRYMLKALKANSNKYVYYLLKSQLPKIQYEGMTDDSHKENFTPIDHMVLSFPRSKDAIYIDEDTPIIDYVYGFQFPDSLKIKWFDYIVVTKQ